MLVLVALLVLMSFPVAGYADDLEANFWITVDDEHELYLDGERIDDGTRTDWHKSYGDYLNLTPGNHVIAVIARDTTGVANIAGFKAALQMPDGNWIITDEDSWKYSLDPDEDWMDVGFVEGSDWKEPTEINYIDSGWESSVEPFSTDATAAGALRIWSDRFKHQGDDRIDTPVYFRLAITVPDETFPVEINKRLVKMIDGVEVDATTQKDTDFELTISKIPQIEASAMDMNRLGEGTSFDGVYTISVNKGAKYDFDREMIFQDRYNLEETDEPGDAFEFLRFEYEFFYDKVGGLVPPSDAFDDGFNFYWYREQTPIKVVITVVNKYTPNNKITVIKTIGSDEGSPQKDVTFGITPVVDTTLPTGFPPVLVKTDEKGIAVFEELREEWNYKIYELVPEGYTSNIDTGKVYTIEEGNDTVVRVINTLIPPVTTVPATTVPATTVPATTVPATTVPATTVPVTVPVTTAPVSLPDNPEDDEPLVRSEVIVVPDETTPLAAPTSVSDVQILEPQVPKDIAVLPKTNELPGTLFYGIGGLLASIGVFMRRK